MLMGPNPSVSLNGHRWLRGLSLGRSLCKRMNQISHGKQREAKNSTPKVDVITEAVFKPKMRPRKQVKGFAEVRKNDHHETAGTK